MFRFLIFLTLLIVICWGKLIDNRAHYSKSSDLGSTKIRRPMPMMDHRKLNNHNKRPVDLLATTTKSVNITALPTTGVFDQTNRPGTIEWKEPKLTFKQPAGSSNDDNVILGPVYRLPIDNDDAGTQIDLKWTYANLKVRPEKITVQAVGPNKATWTVSVMEGTMTSATWDLRATPSYRPLIEGYYTLQVHDQRGQDSLPKPGWLLPDNKMQIALYKTEGNNHIGEKIAPFECATCFNYVMNDLDHTMQASTNKNYANCTLMMAILLLWAFL